MSDEYSVNIAEKFVGKLKAQGELTIADFVYDLAVRYKDLTHQNKRLRMENDEFVGRVARLEGALTMLVNGDSINDISIEKEMIALLVESPQQSLNSVKAAAVERAFIAISLTMLWMRRVSVHRLRNEIIEYTNKLRNGEVE